MPPPRASAVAFAHSGPSSRLNPSMRTLTLFYDGGCGLCGKLRDRFESEPAEIRLDFVAYQSVRAKELVPDLDWYHPERGILALTDEGQLLQGVDSWLEMLAATNRFRLAARFLGASFLRPLTKAVYEKLAENRRDLSRILGLKNLTPEEEGCQQCTW